MQLEPLNGFLCRPGGGVHIAALCLAWSLAHVAHAVDIPATVPLPVVPGDDETRSTPFIAWYEDLGKSGYVEEEFSVSGDANIYEYVDDESQSSAVRMRDEAIPYTSRLLIRRPADAERFNGTLYLEVLNPTAGWDGDPIWQNTHEYMMREGAIYAGLTSKPVALNFLRDKWGRDPYPQRDSSRYAKLEMPYFGHDRDMLSESGGAAEICADADGNPPGRFSRFGGTIPHRLLAVSAPPPGPPTPIPLRSRRQACRGTPLTRRLLPVAGGSAKKHQQAHTGTEGLPPGDRRNLVDVDVPVVRFQTETEVPRSHRLRQHPPEYPLVRIYEMAGGAHVDQATVDVGGKALTRDLGLPSFAAGCDNPVNPVRIGYVQSATLEIIDQWVRGTAEPPPSRVIDLVDGEDGSMEIARDAAGNALGGVRLPSLAAPLGSYLPNNTGAGFCFLIGSFVPFEKSEVARLYPERQDYVLQVIDAAGRAVADRFLLEADAQRLRKEAAGAVVGN